MIEGVSFRPRAERDIQEYYHYLRREAGLSTAVRFTQALEVELSGLAEMPEKGSPRHVNRRLTGLRQWRLSGFDRVLIFYLPSDEGIEVLRVVHGARDTRRILRREH